MTGTGTQTRMTRVTTIALLVLCTGELKMNANYVGIGRVGQLKADFQQVLLVQFF